MPVCWQHHALTSLRQLSPKKRTQLLSVPAFARHLAIDVAIDGYWSVVKDVKRDPTILALSNCVVEALSSISLAYAAKPISQFALIPWARCADNTRFEKQLMKSADPAQKVAPHMRHDRTNNFLELSDSSFAGRDRFLRIDSDSCRQERNRRTHESAHVD
jgi:hypothetical protein